ncbi:MAG: hypothetical protein LC802_19645 [Acidobacteria bacterium]|nr:hypothetical protein [Acidobacteriota bacterium]
MKNSLSFILSVRLINRPAEFSLSWPAPGLDVRANPHVRPAHPKLA